MYVHHAYPGTLGGWKVSGPLELELWKVVSHHVCSGTGSSERAASPSPRIKFKMILGFFFSGPGKAKLGVK